MSISDRRLEAFREQIASNIAAIEHSTDYVVEEINLTKQSTRVLGDAREKWETQVEIVVRQNNTDDVYTSTSEPIDRASQILEAFADVIADRVRSKL